ncbi:protein FAM185A isoform X2 [Aethina tumida]|uniref:protein FAM185A isoform X2 n=1 Tax=Aethina tumida TaxID=116153 RepID=UPI0021479AC8|nr:protein FAM185A isoform X2 [Aethina tumida]
MFTKIVKKIVRYYSVKNINNKLEFQIPTFCNLSVNIPNKVNITPLDVHKYQNCDRLIIESTNYDIDSIKCTTENNHINITTKNDYESDLNITAPVKANLEVTSNSDIFVGSFNSDTVNLQSNLGSICVDKYHGDKIQLQTQTGNITIRGPVQASNFISTVLKSGDITTGKIQCLNTQLSTRAGNIKIPSSYSESSYFNVGTGKLDLNNIHKNCKISLEKGVLNLAGFDGMLFADLGTVEANLQLSRITEDSFLKIDIGNLHLQIAEDCQKSCMFEIQARNVTIDKNMQSVNKKQNLYIFSNDAGILKPKVTIHCINGDIHISAASWQDLLKLKFNV